MMPGTVTLGSVLHDAARILALLHEPIDPAHAFPDAWIKVRQDVAGLDRRLYRER